MMTLRYRSFKSDVAKRPPSRGTKGRNSGGMTGMAFMIIQAGLFSLFLVESLKASTTFKRFKASVLRCLEVSVFALCLNS